MVSALLLRTSGHKRGAQQTSSWMPVVISAMTPALAHMPSTPCDVTVTRSPEQSQPGRSPPQTCRGKHAAGTACLLLRVPRGWGSPAIISSVNKCLKSTLVRAVTDRRPGPKSGPATKNTMIFKWATHTFSLCGGSPTAKLPARNVHTSLPEHCTQIRCCQNSVYLCSCHKELLLLYFFL